LDTHVNIDSDDRTGERCVSAGMLKELKPLSALPWSLLPAMEEEEDSVAPGKSAGRKREWRGRGLSGLAGGKRQRTAVEYKAMDFAELEDWEEGTPGTQEAGSSPSPFFTNGVRVPYLDSALATNRWYKDEGMTI